MNTCSTCKHFSPWKEDEDYPQFRGECVIELPRWMNATFDIAHFVRTDDTCSFHTPKKEGK